MNETYVFLSKFLWFVGTIYLIWQNSRLERQNERLREQISIRERTNKLIEKWRASRLAATDPVELTVRIDGHLTLKDGDGE